LSTGGLLEGMFVDSSCIVCSCALNRAISCCIVVALGIGSSAGTVLSTGGLLDGIVLPAQVRRAIDRLLEQKTRSSELGKGKRLRVLDRWIERQLGRGEQRCNDLPAKTAILAEAEDYYRQVVETNR